MKSILTASFVLATLFGGVTIGLCEEPAVKLPKENSWARYHFSSKGQGRPEVTGTMTLKSLKKAEVNGTAARWFESESITEKLHERRKFLLTEKGILDSERPLDEGLRYLQRDEDQQLVSLNPETQGWQAVEFLHFPGFVKNAKLVDAPRTVAFQRGSISIPQAYERTYQWQRKDRKPESTSLKQWKYRVWMHPDMPSGFAYATLRLEVSLNGQEIDHTELEYSLRDFGDDPQVAIIEGTAAGQ